VLVLAPDSLMPVPQEDQRLAELVQIHGPKRWSQIAADLGTKGSKQVSSVSGVSCSVPPAPSDRRLTRVHAPIPTTAVPKEMEKLFKPR